MFGILSEDSATKPYLIFVEEFESPNNVTISRFVQKSLTTIFLPNAIPSDEIVLMFADA